MDVYVNVDVDAPSARRVGLRPGRWTPPAAGRVGDEDPRMACSGVTHFISVLAAVEAKPWRRCSRRSQPRLQLRALLRGWLWLASRRDLNHERSFTMAFQVEELSIQLVEALVPLMPRIRQRDSWRE